MKYSLTNRLREYALLMRLDKPIGIFLLLWPALWALLVASEGQPDPQVLLVFVLGVILMRSAGCVANDYVDRDIDRHVSRTQNRPLTAGRVSKLEAKLLFAVLCLAAFGLVLLLNRLTIMLSFIGLALAVTYPFMKRVTHLPQVYLGATFGWAVPMAFAAQTNSVPHIAWLMYTATVLWATAYDTMYAMVDRQDDLVLGVKSTAILFGESDRYIIGVIQVMLLISLIMIGMQAELGWIYYASLIVAAGLAVYQQNLIRYREREACFRAFLNNNWFGAVIFLGMLLDYLFRT
ncbi:MAG: 4-hydroxybenzoate octaprenyltransferase [Pseudomonadota bacterium]|jgi:4-hydroxybenzoate polyprenyltransferase|nr:4-hydroxybenzoate octaprenyltransferase [Pseudomonadota bacterium]